MSVQIRGVSAFGRRSSDEVWARASGARRELPISSARLGVSLVLLGALGALLMHDALALLGAGAAGSLWMAPAGLGPWLAGAPATVAAALLMLAAGLVAQYGFLIVSMGLSGQPAALVDSWGISVLTRDGGTVMAWDEVEALRFGLGCARLARRPGAVQRQTWDPAMERMQVRVPLFLVRGGSQAFREAVAEVRPDVARRFYG